MIFIPHVGSVGYRTSNSSREPRAASSRISRVVNQHAGISPQLAIRLAMALGGSAESWLNMQMAYDRRQAQRKSAPKIQRLAA
jgi:addiction module HigA family antidote